LKLNLEISSDEGDAPEFGGREERQLFKQKSKQVVQAIKKRPQ
jgi:hypothetical protein